MTAEVPTSTTTRPAARKGRSFMSTLTVVFALILVVALVIFVLQNTMHTTINFIGWNFDLAQGVWLLGAAVVGSLITLLVSAALRVRRAVR